MSVSLNKVAGIELSQGDYESALAKYTESLDIMRALAETDSEPDAWNDVAWSLGLISRIIFPRDPKAALVQITQAHRIALNLARPEQESGNVLDTAATVWEITTECLNALGRTNEANNSASTAAAIRQRITELS